MPAYFAYGSNMDAVGLRARCPRSRILFAAVLPAHRFVLMGRSGYASVRLDAGADVHGVLIDLAAADIAALDDYEDVAGGLYARAERDVHAANDAHRALIYLGADPSEGGVPPPGYMECIIAAARAAALPQRYVASLAKLLASAAQLAKRQR